ncbi:MAG: LamG domain-containing protein [bacterium]|nr:LamG domain-containing protein [bacterium]
MRSKSLSFNRFDKLTARSVSLGLIAIAAIAIALTTYAAGAKDFRLYLQANDNGCSNQLGISQHGDFVNATVDWGTAPMVSDGNGYDPDCYRANLNMATLEPVSSLAKDFRLCLQMVDNVSLDASGKVKGYGQTGAFKCTPWASDGGGGSGWATDGNGYDPDGGNLMIETRAIPAGSPIISDVRIGLRLSDKACTAQIGKAEFTPWASQGGGWSNFASDSNKYDPDCLEVISEVITEGDACTEAIPCADNKVLSLANTSGLPGEGQQYLVAIRKPDLGNTPIPSIFNLGNTLTYEMDIFKTAHNRYGGLITTAGDPDMRHNGSPSLYNSANGEGLTFRVGVSNDKNQCKSSCKEYTLNQKIPLGVWTHIAITVTNGKTLTWYVNGSAVQEQTLGGWNTSATPRQEKLYIGDDVPGASEYQSAKIDEVRVWKVARTASQIKANMNKKLVGNEADLVNYWNFDNGAIDVTGHSGAFGGTAELKNGASLIADPAINPLQFCTRNICPKPPAPPDPTQPDPIQKGALRINRLMRLASGASGQSALNTRAGITPTTLITDNPAVFVQLAASSYPVYFTDLPGEERLGLCQFNIGDSECTPTSYTAVSASNCSGGICSMLSKEVTAGKMTAVTVTYETIVNPIIPPPPPPPPLLPANCSDGIDNNNNQLIDLNDSGCTAGGPGETNSVVTPTCTLTATPATLVLNIGYSRLEWNCTSGGQVMITDNRNTPDNNFPDIGGPKLATGFVNVAPDKTTTFTVTGDGVSAYATVTVGGSDFDVTDGL